MARKWTPRKNPAATVTMTCATCRQPIRRGSQYVRGLTHEPYHPNCKRFGVLAAQDIQPRYLHGDPTGQPCAGCGQPVELGELIVHIMARPWHRECRL